MKLNSSRHRSVIYTSLQLALLLFRSCDGRPRTRHIRLYLHLPSFQQQTPSVTHVKEPWEINQDVCPPSLCMWHEESKRHRPHVTGASSVTSLNMSRGDDTLFVNGSSEGSPFYEGDIVLDKAMRGKMFPVVRQTSRKGRRRRAAVRSRSRLWPKGRIPFVFAKDLGKKLRRIIGRVMKHIEESTCIRFTKKRTKDVDYIYFIKEPGCWSLIGRVKGPQKISLGEGCDFFGTVLHETVHALGFWHEQSRPDRDKYVKINRQNIGSKYRENFKKLNSTVASSWGFPYDYRSVTHYSKTAYSRLGKDTIEVVGPGKKLKLRIGQRKELSNLDIAQLSEMYRCNKRRDDNETVCQDGWVKYRRSCYNFIWKHRFQFAAASKHCSSIGARLVRIGNEKEDDFLKKHLSTLNNLVYVWRTAGRKIGTSFVWYDAAATKKSRPMKFTKWRKNHPAGFSSMALVRGSDDRFVWQGVWSGSRSQLPDYSYPFICEKKPRRKCFKGKYKDGRDYRGKLSHTKNLKTCQKWSSQWPRAHKIKVTSKSRKSDGLGDHNLCRNPEALRRKRPWCYTTKGSTKWEYCDVTICK